KEGLLTSNTYYMLVTKRQNNRCEPVWVSRPLPPGCSKIRAFPRECPLLCEKPINLSSLGNRFPEPSTTGRGSAISVASQELSSVYLGRPPLDRAENYRFF